MKVLMPYVDIGNGNITDSVVSGGAELFSRLIVENFDTTIVNIPWNTTRKDNKKYLIQMRNLVEEHKIDLILSNNIKAICFYALRDIGIPIMHITHTNYGLFTANETLAKMSNFGHSIFAVSQYNKDYFDNRSVRLNQPIIDFSGIVPPAYCQYDLPVVFVPDTKIISVGRSNSYKHPFGVYDMVKKTDYRAEVITSVGIDHDSITYYNRNKHLPHLLKLPHSQVINHIANSAALVMGCTKETFGIAALEALSVGTPIIVKPDVNGRHASTELVSDTSHYAVVKKSVDTKSALDMLRKVDRQSIKDMTQEKHSKLRWINTYSNAFDSTVEKFKKVYKPYNTVVTEFFTF